MLCPMQQKTTLIKNYAVDRDERDCETCSGGLHLPFYEVLDGDLQVLHDPVLLLLRDRRPDRVSDGFKIDKVSKVFCRGQFSWAVNSLKIFY